MNQASASSDAAVVARGPYWMVPLFILSLLLPIYFSVGALLLSPHRLFLLLAFLPLFLRLFVFRKAGPVLAADWLVFGSSLWAGVSLAVNHPISVAIEPFGIHVLEMFGAYLLARVCIRNGQDFARMVKVLFLAVLFLLPFAAVESIRKTPVLLELIPGAFSPNFGMGERFGLRRAQAVFAHPILYGVFASTAFGMFWFVLRPRALGVFGSATSAIATAFSLSSGALISLVVQSVFIGWEEISKKYVRRWLLFAGGAVLGYIFVDIVATRTPWHTIVAYASFSVNSAYTRIHIFNHGMENVLANPLFGIGLNDWVRPRWLTSSVDNFWLLNAMRYGIPSFVLLVVALYLLVRRVANTTLSSASDQAARAGYLVSFGGLAIAGGTVHYWHTMMAFAFFIIASGVWLGTGGARTEDVDVSADVPDNTPETRPSRYTRQTKVKHRPSRGTVPARSQLASEGHERGARRNTRVR